jgi:hypothetical protein
MITTGDIRQANKAGLNGLYSGAAIGGITGSMSGYKYAKDNGLNPWTGEENVSIAELTNAQLVQKAATKAEAAIGGTGKVAGTAKHEYATELLERYQSIYGDRGLRFKVPFNNGPGNRGFLDILDHTNGIIYDWKFGYPGMTPIQLNNTPQMFKYQRNFGLPTQIIKP